MAGIIITLIICVTVFLIVREVNRDGNCTDNLLFKKGDDPKKITDLADKYDNFKIYQSRFGKFTVEASHEGYDDGMY